MRPFEASVLKSLNAKCGEPIDHVGLGYHDFSLAFGDVRRLSGQFKVTFSLQGRIGLWEDGPIDFPVWLLLGQVPTAFELVDDFTLRMKLGASDHVDFHSDDSPYEAVVINFGSTEDATIMEVF